MGSAKRLNYVRKASYSRNLEKIEAEKELDGFYVIRTDLNKEVASTAEVVSNYKALSHVERVFSADLDIRPIRHHVENRVRAHVFLTMLSYYVSWHMNERCCLKMIIQNQQKNFVAVQLHLLDVQKTH